MGLRAGDIGLRVQASRVRGFETSSSCGLSGIGVPKTRGVSKMWGFPKLGVPSWGLWGTKLGPLISSPLM